MGYQTYPVRLFGGRLALDFINTADWSPDVEVIDEKLGTQEDLAIWCRETGLGNHASAVLMEPMAALRTFRSGLRKLFLKALERKHPDDSDLSVLNDALALAGPAQHVNAADDKAAIEFSQSVPLRKVIALSAASLLTSETEIARVKLCPSDDCGWLFLDESRNGRRRWCAMETCGNREKARRHYQRHGAKRT